MKVCQLKEEDVIVDDTQLRGQTYLVENTRTDTSWITIGAEDEEDAVEMVLESAYGKSIEELPDHPSPLSAEDLIAKGHLPVVRKNRSDVEERFTELVKALNEAELSEKNYTKLKEEIESRV